MSRFIPLAVFLIFLAKSVSAQPPVADLKRADFEQILEELRPDVDQPWRTIPWKISLLDAQGTAAKQQKPIFIWAMDGHPLGCT